MIILPSIKGIIKPMSFTLGSPPALTSTDGVSDTYPTEIMWNFNSYNCKNNGTIITVDNTPVTSWTSVGVLTESMSSTGVTNPTWYASVSEFKNKPAVYFNGTTDVLDLTSAVLNAGTGAGANGVAVGITFSVVTKPASNVVIFEYGAPTFPSTQYYSILAGATTVLHRNRGITNTALASYTTRKAYSTFMANRNYLQVSYYINYAVVNGSSTASFYHAGNNAYRYYPRIRIAPQTPIYISQIVVYKYTVNTAPMAFSASSYSTWYNYYNNAYGSVNY